VDAVRRYTPPQHLRSVPGTFKQFQGDSRPAVLVESVPSDYHTFGMHLDGVTPLFARPLAYMGQGNVADKRQ